MTQIHFPLVQQVLLNVLVRLTTVLLKLGAQFSLLQYFDCSTHLSTCMKVYINHQIFLNEAFHNDYCMLNTLCTRIEQCNHFSI